MCAYRPVSCDIQCLHMLLLTSGLDECLKTFCFWFYACRTSSSWHHHPSCLTPCSSLMFHLPHWKEHYSMFPCIRFSLNLVAACMLACYDYSGARKKVKRVKRAFSSRQARRAQNLSSMRYKLLPKCLYVPLRQHSDNIYNIIVQCSSEPWWNWGGKWTNGYRGTCKKQLCL